MKYIRTKDGVKKVRGENLIDNTVSYYNSRGILASVKTNKAEIADTIEELCDEFVCGDNYKAHCVLHRESFEDSYWKVRLLDNDKTVIVYGAIWTDKGLIYVAKMNEKGELELL